MVDDRYSRPKQDAYGQPAGQSRSGNDPLAELARLIGNNDPFAGYGGGAGERAPAQQQQQQPADWPEHETALPDPRLAQLAATYRDDPYAAQRQNEAPYAQASEHYPAADSYPPQQGAAYYSDGNTQVHADEDMYQAPPARSRALVIGGAAAAALLLTVGGVYGYRSIFGGTRSTSPPPVIKAETTPSKVTPPPQTQTDPISGKLIQDRVGGSSGERVVSREEQPIDMRDRPPPSRVIFPGAGASGNIASSSADSRQASAAPAPNSTEPKKIRTIAIKPDAGPGATDAAPSPVPTRTASTARAAPAAEPTPPLAPAVRQIPAPTSQRQQTAAAAPAATGNGPLSLSPDAAPAAATPSRTASVAPRAPAPASSGGSGTYVQVSSQRSEADARTSFNALQAKYPNVLGGRPVAIRQANLGDKGTYYRAMVGPLATEQANELCTNLKAAGGSCIVQRN